jgi:hypothetical protein
MWYLVKCPNQTGNPNIEHLTWVANAQPTVVAADEGPTAAGAQAASTIALPSPSIHLNPATFGVVNLKVWLAIDPSLWHPFQATATARGVTASAVATPETVTWNMGDGHTVECDGPGSVYDPSLPMNTQSTSCGYIYQRTSAGEPSGDGNPNDGAFPVTATVTWVVTWTAVGEPGGGVLPSLQTSTTIPLRVEQVESVGTGQTATVGP